jgi:hypothetical protein
MERLVGLPNETSLSALRFMRSAVVRGNVLRLFWKGRGVLFFSFPLRVLPGVCR